MKTYNGRILDVLNFTEADVDIEDIAHSLSQICRFTGHTKGHYSVAQHCLLVSEMVPSSYALEGLLHEAEEPYTNDLHTELKYAHGMRIYREIGRQIRDVVWRHFGLESCEDVHRMIKTVDTTLCELEKLCLFKDSKLDRIKPMPAEEAEKKFLQRFIDLTF